MTQTRPAPVADAFPGAGHAYRVDFGGGNAFEIAFGTDATMTYTKLQEPGRGRSETVSITQHKIRDSVHMVHWQEADRTTVVHVEDFAKGIVHTNITLPDGTFFNAASTLIPVR